MNCPAQVSGSDTLGPLVVCMQHRLSHMSTGESFVNLAHDPPTFFLFSVNQMLKKDIISVVYFA